LEKGSKGGKKNTKIEELKAQVLADANKSTEPSGLKTFSVKAHPGVKNVKDQFETEKNDDDEDE